MQASGNNLPPESRSTVALTVAGAQALLRMAWYASRLAVFALLVVLEPLVRIALCGLAFLGLLTVLVIKFTANLPDFPFWGTLGLSIGCVLLLAVYYGIIRLLAES